jgi:aspartate aminotransferase
MRMLKNLSSPATLEIGQFVRERKIKGEQVISLGLGEPAFDTPATIINEANNAMKSGYNRYSSPLGLEEFRIKIKNELKSYNSIETEKENIMITPGAKNAIFISLMTLLKPRDEVIISSPHYVSYFPQIKMAEPESVVRTVNLKKSDFSLNFDLIKKNVNNKTRVILLNYPNNPTGKMISEEDIKALIEIIKNKKRCYIISDEIYDRLNFSGKTHNSFAKYEEIKDRVITINGFSKAFSITGWRIGYLVGNSEFVKTALKIQQHINTNTCTFIQKAIYKAYDECLKFIDKQNTLLKENAFLLSDILEGNKNITINKPQGGLFSFLNIKKTCMDSEEFSCKLIKEKGVVLIPGIRFGKNWDDHVRVTLSTKKEEFKEGIQIINEFVKKC